MSAGQSRKASLLETFAGTGAGFALSVWVQQLLFPAMGYDLAFRENLLVATVFTSVSLLRGYVLRRFFNHFRHLWP